MATHRQQPQPTALMRHKASSISKTYNHNKTYHIKMPKHSKTNNQNHLKNSTNKVRIIGGQFKSRQIDFANVNGLRPTPDRLRETLFNWLMGHLNDAVVLDMCAGSGVLGFESLSRGAKHVTFIEPNPLQIKYLYQTIKHLKLTDNQAYLINSTAEQALLTNRQSDTSSHTTSIQSPFDIVFIDPPYALNLWQNLLTLLIEQHLIHQNSMIYMEADRPLQQIITGTEWANQQLNIYKHKKIGQIFAYLLTY